MTRRLLVMIALTLGMAMISAKLASSYVPEPDPRCFPTDCPVDPN